MRLLGLGLLLLSIVAHASQEPCESALQADFWGTHEPHRVGGMPLTYSFDSELRDADVFRLLSQSESGRKLLQSKFGARVFTLDQLASRTGVSVKQVQTFALKRDVDRTQARFALSDLRPKFMATAVGDKRKGLTRYWNIVTGWLSPPAEVGAIESDLRGRGMPVRAHLDYSGLQVEVTHENFDASPAGFRALVRDGMHAVFEMPQTHLHLGLPGTLSAEQAHAIARAIETRIILAWVASSDEAGARLMYFEGSTLRRDIKQAEIRGSVRLQLNEWTDPHPTHNLEIRQWESIDHGLELLALAGELALSADRLRVQAGFDSARIEDPYTNNLNGALKYAGYILSASPATAETGQGLLELAREAESAGEITPALRKKAHRFVNQHGVVELLGKGAFLN